MFTLELNPPQVPCRKPPTICPRAHQQFHWKKKIFFKASSPPNMGFELTPRKSHALLTEPARRPSKNFLSFEWGGEAAGDLNALVARGDHGCLHTGSADTALWGCQAAPLLCPH